LTQLLRRALSLGALCLCFAGPALAQAPAAAPNTGAIKLTTGVDFPSVYYFRGIRQETDPKLTMQPYGDVGITLATADAGLKSATVNFGVWNSLHTGSSGSDVAGQSSHYEEDFYAGLTLGFAPVNFTTKYVAYTSPNGLWGPVKELDLTFAGTQKYAPYATLAFELGDKSADGGSSKGSYLELGAGPNWPVGKATFTIPVSIGLSMKDYYEGGGKDNKFGFFDVGGLITVPFSGVPAKYGSWNFHARADYLRLGNGTVLASGTDGNKNQGVVSAGIGLSY
jgi:hypothetical protein